MRYYEVTFTITPDSQDARDVLAAVASEAGFESFCEKDNVWAGYVQTEAFNQPLLDEAIASFPLPHVNITYAVGEMEDKNWNETWEQQGFAPIVIGNKCIIYDAKDVLHDSEQPVSSSDSSSHTEAQPLLLAIDAKQAFGTGNHETTRMIVDTLFDLDLHNRRILDCGCGTGILGIVAAKRGASEVVAYDIDDWSVRNTQHNAQLNNVEIEVLEGDKSVLTHISGVFDVLMANINRNILIADMPAFKEVMNHPATLILSGFYEEDVPVLLNCAHKLGLKEVQRKTEGKWCCLVLKRK